MARLCDKTTTSYSILKRIVGDEKAEAIISTLGGEAVYIPKREKEGRDELIKAEFQALLESGSTCMSSYSLLADEWGLSSSRIMQIVNH
jgi:hypothetical protein